MPKNIIIQDILKDLDIDLTSYLGTDIKVHSPIEGQEIAAIKTHNTKQTTDIIAKSKQAFTQWREIPAPRRGELVRQFGDMLRHYKEPLSQLVTLECGKIIDEARGEVQEMIDICDFAVGLSRQIGGLTLPSERPQHVMHENWLPLGVVGVISAFNFPVAVWAWNAALALICGDSVIWKPSEKTPLTAIACHELFVKTCAAFGDEASQHLCQLLLGDATIGETIVKSKNVALISATGSTAMGRKVAPIVAARFGKYLLELGGNNAAIITPSADREVMLPSIVFGAVGTAGQRCTTTRRMIVHQSIIDNVYTALKSAYQSLPSKIGNPLNSDILIGPLIDQQSFDAMQQALKTAQPKAVEIIGGKRVIVDHSQEAYYVEPALVRLKKQEDFVQQETFAPIAYIMPYQTLEQAVAIQNDVPQGLSSTIFTTDMREAEYFKQHSDCGIANVNIGTSGAEIGGAFGGEKETGGGRESGSDSWKAYMYRQTSTAYYGKTEPALAQGVTFPS